jgi:hypothetical protein
MCQLPPRRDTRATMTDTFYLLGDPVIGLSRKARPPRVSSTSIARTAKLLASRFPSECQVQPSISRLDSEGLKFGGHGSARESGRCT